MTVYVLEVGTYDDCFVRGVYSSPESAMRALPRTDWEQQPWGWASRGESYGDDAVIHPFEIDAPMNDA